MSFKMPLSLLICIFVVTSAVAAGVARRKRSDDAAPLEAVVAHLSQQVTSLTAKVAALEAKTESLDQKVAFHAWSNKNPINAGANSPIILNNAVTNVGNAYNTVTGVFTAPVSGLYDFQAAIMVEEASHPSAFSRGAIVVGNTMVAITLSDSRHGGYDHGTMKAVVHVNAGQMVYLKNVDNHPNDYYDGTLPYTTFSGFLISAD